MKKVVMRKCLVSNEMFLKKDLIRVVRNKDLGIVVDLSGKINGRGAYIKLSAENIKTAREKNIFKRALNADIDPSIYDKLESLLDE